MHPSRPVVRPDHLHVLQFHLRRNSEPEGASEQGAGIPFPQRVTVVVGAACLVKRNGFWFSGHRWW